ncbi:MAG: hypothetical protein GXY08_09155 [Ruminococcus sp.]|nr:hypothetical protein [Ruminococcus sp.]
MKKEKLFDILEKAEDDSMERLIDKCPEISDEELDKILEMSERKFNMKKKDMNENVQRENGGITVSGVERVKRPAWIKPFTMAASFVLVAGMVVGTVALMNKGKSGSSENDKIAADVFNDKDALIDLCSNAPSHYDKLEASCTISYTRDDLSITDIEKVEYDSKEKYLFIDEIEDHHESNPEADDETYFIYYYYKNKSTIVSPYWDWYEVDTLNNDWDYDNYSSIDVNGQPFFDPKPFFDPDTIYLSSSQSLLNKDEWSITGSETICGRECVAVSQESDAYKLNDYFDSETGVLLKSVYEDVNNKEQTVFEVTDIKYNEDAHVTAPLKFRKMIEEAGYEPFYPTSIDEDGNEINPAVMCNLDFLGIPEQAFTTAAAKKDIVTTTTTTTAATTTKPEVTTEPVDGRFLIDDVVGQWEYQVSDGTHTAGENPVYNGLINIYPNGKYEYIDVDGNVTTGTAKTGFEEIAGSELPKVDFFEDSEWSFGAYFHDNIMDIGNGGLRRLVRVLSEDSTVITEDEAYNAVNNYCHLNYDWSKSNDNPDIMYVTKGSITNTEYEIIFRSYTGSFVHFYVFKGDGNCRIMEENPITNELEESGTINIRDYMAE